MGIICKRTIIRSICLFVMPATLFPLFADTLIAPTDPRINYYGRFDITNPAQPRCNWSGSIIEARVPGPSIGMSISHNAAFYDIEIDGVLDTTISIGTTRQYTFRTDLSSAMHTVRIILRSEDHYNAGTFFGLYLANGKELGSAPVKPQRKIEFIGDSYTAGYGIESPGRDCSQDNKLNKYTNANRTFAANVTRAFHAQSIILGWSGAGMVKNYAASKDKRSSDPFPFYYPRVLGAVNDAAWNFSNWIPELVVICLGTNDYTSNRNATTNPPPDDSMYIGDYHKFIGRILGNYPDVSILCVSTQSGAFENNVKKVISEETTTFNHPKIYFAAFPDQLALTGCDWHPTIEDNKKVAAVLVDTIMKKLNWDTTTSVVAMRMPVEKCKTPRPFTVITSGELIHLTGSAALPADVSYSLLNMRGELLDKKMAGPDRGCTFRTAAPGIYCAGNNRYGWMRVAVKR